MKSSRAVFAVFALLALLLLGGASTRSAAGAPTFRDFSGTNQGGPKNDLLRDSISWDRAHIAWDALEP